MKKWKGLKKDSRSFYEVISFSSLNVFAPFKEYAPLKESMTSLNFLA
jgi:hypothetical protein